MPSAENAFLPSARISWCKCSRVFAAQSSCARVVDPRRGELARERIGMDAGADLELAAQRLAAAASVAVEALRAIAARLQLAVNVVELGLALLERVGRGV